MVSSAKLTRILSGTRWTKSHSASVSRPAKTDRLRELHPYDVPEILVRPVDHGLAGYLDWVRAETA